MGNLSKMALSARLVSQRCLLLSNGGFKLLTPSSSMATIKSMSPEEHQTSKEEFWEKNKRLNRPISPHLTIYKPQMTSMLSITHRGTGLAQSVILTGFAVGAIASNSTFPIFLAYLQSWKFGGALIFLGKFAIAWPVTYHLFNGLRHLAWDMGYGFKMPDLYKTGWTVLGTSVVTGVLLAML